MTHLELIQKQTRYAELSKLPKSELIKMARNLGCFVNQGQSKDALITYIVDTETVLKKVA